MSELQWSEQMIEKITRITTGLEKKQSNQLRVKLLKRIVKRIDERAQAECMACEQYKQDVSKLVGMIIDERNGETIDYSSYESTLLEVRDHLKKDHKLIEEGTYMLQWLLIGLVCGVFFVSQYAGAVSLGISFGIIIGAILDQNAKRAGKVI